MNITSRLRIKAFSYRDTFEGYQQLVREYYWHGIKIWTTVLDREQIPQYAIISMCCLGDESGWKSKFYHIKEAWIK